MTEPVSTLTAFVGFERVAAGPPADVIVQLRSRPDGGSALVFDDGSGAQIDLDLRSDAANAADATGSPTSSTSSTARGVGRPKLGVVAREVTLLPRHWDWLSRQPGGASVALRRLVDDARRVNVERDAVRAAREATYRFMTAIAGDLAGFEEATRALFAGEKQRFDVLTAAWPSDVAAHARRLAGSAWIASTEAAHEQAA